MLLCVLLFAVSAAAYICNHKKSLLFALSFDCKFISLYDNVANLFFLLCHLVVVIYFFELEGGGCAGVLWLTTIYNAEYLLLSLRLSRVDVSAADRVLL